MKPRKNTALKSQSKKGVISKNLGRKESHKAETNNLKEMMNVKNKPDSMVHSLKNTANFYKK